MELPKEQVIDISGIIANGMWQCEPPFPRFNKRPFPTVDWVEHKVYLDYFEGMSSQTGTYLETPAHIFGDESYNIDAIPLTALIDRRCVVLQVHPETAPATAAEPTSAAATPDLAVEAARPPITAAMLAAAPNVHLIRPGDALLVSAAWGSRWFDPDYLSAAPYFTRDAMYWLISRRPFILGSDVPRWDNLAKPQGFFHDFYAADILMLAPCVNLEHAPAEPMRLTALPLPVADTCCVPCRAILRIGKTDE
ncbi:MAG: cyclase family protein [Clostridiaceae bacterium]|nr:cyclase family protein [Clostridiaceae bacterium]